MKITPIHQWVGRALEKGHLSQAEMARRLTEELRRDIDRAAVNKMAKGTRVVSADEMLAMETITGYPAPSPHVAALVPMLDWVSAGKLSEPKSQIPYEDVPLLAYADLGSGEFFALRVQGDSMDRLSPEGSTIIVNRADKTLVNGKCYVFAHRGQTTYKRWNADPEYLAPYSWNPQNEPIFIKKMKDLEVIGRVRRTVLDL